jgi:hypothetical protein
VVRHDVGQLGPHTLIGLNPGLATCRVGQQVGWGGVAWRSNHWTQGLPRRLNLV